MNKYQYKRMLLDLLLANGEDYITKNPKVYEQWNNEYDDDLTLEENLDNFFKVSESLDDIDPRQFTTYMNSIQRGNANSPLNDIYRTYRNEEDIHSDFNNAKDIYPHEIMGYKEDEFYNPSNPNYWGGMNFYRNNDGTLDSTRGFLKKMVENNMETKEFLKLLQDEQRKRDLNRIWDFNDKRNYEGLGSGDGLLDEAYRKLVGFSANNYWGNTVNDYKNGSALEDENYGVFGLNPFDVASNVADGVTSLATPFAPIGKVGNVIRGVGIANDVVQPIAREGYESDHYGRSIDPINIFKEEGIRLAPQVLSIAPKLPGKLGEVADKVDNYTFGNQKVEDAWNAFTDKSKKSIKEQSSKPMYNPNEYNMVDEFGNPVKSTEAISDLREVRNPSNFIEEPLEDGSIMVTNKLGSDIEGMDAYLYARDKNIELEPSDVDRIRELAKKYPEFNKKYFTQDMTKGNKVANVSAKSLIDNGKKAIARNGVEPIDVSNLGKTKEDYNTISKAYNEIASRKPDAVYKATHYNGSNSGLNEYEKAIVKKYLELNLYFGSDGFNVFN